MFLVSIFWIFTPDIEWADNAFWRLALLYYMITSKVVRSSSLKFTLGFGIAWSIAWENNDTYLDVLVFTLSRNPLCCGMLWSVNTYSMVTWSNHRYHLDWSQWHYSPCLQLFAIRMVDIQKTYQESQVLQVTVDWIIDWLVLKWLNELSATSYTTVNK